MESLRKISAVELLPAHNGSLIMTKEELIERALREAGIFPPSVTNPHYADKTEMTRAEITVKSLEEMGLLSLSAPDPEFAEKIWRIQLVVAELQLRLPDGEITTCGAFSLLNVGCCNICHTDPLHGMTLIDLHFGGSAWLCCAVDAASSPEPCLILHEQEEDSLGAIGRTCKYRNGGRRED